MNKHIVVVLTFDTEDYITPESDDAILHIARILESRAITGTFFVVGEKARILRQRARSDVIAALSRHDIGYHSDKHSFHPTIAEYLECAGWYEGIEQVVERECKGVDLVRDTFNRELCGFATPGTSWGPQVAPATRLLGMPSHVHSFTKTKPIVNPHWFAGTLCLHRGAAIGPLDNTLHDGRRFTTFYENLPIMLQKRAESGEQFVQIFVGHPTCIVTKMFWDQLNFADGRNPRVGETLHLPPLRTAKEIAFALNNFTRLIELLQSLPWVQLKPLGTVVNQYLHETRVYSDIALSETVYAAYAADDIITHLPWVSSADLVYLLAKKTTNALAYVSGSPLPSVLGPLHLPPAWNESVSVPWSTIVGLSHHLCRHVEKFGTLPASVSYSRLTIPIGAFYQTLVTSYAAKLAGKSSQDEIEILPSPRIPAIGNEIADMLKVRISQWLHKPGLDPSRIAEFAALQAWSIRSAQVMSTRL